ncbi:MAG: helix-turn-helix transcriptional regulator [Burkholderiaceae bacterium]|jgi:transcriptional regulator with XRE-family HTH domain|nr:helix-turn-helix transcriptional regulator [Burkholderiaceae bacterium]
MSPVIQAKTRTRKTRRDTTELSADAKVARKSKRQREIDGLKLINKIRVRSVELAVQDRHIAEMIGVTPIYWYSIANGHRKISSLSKEKLKKIAEFLHIPTIHAMNLAGALGHDDFFHGNLENQLDVSIEQMRNDPEWMCWAPTNEEWKTLSIGTRIGIVMLYETVFYRSFLSRMKMEAPKLQGKVDSFVKDKFANGVPSASDKKG